MSKNKVVCSECGWIAVKGDIIFKCSGKHVCKDCVGLYTKDQTERYILKREDEIKGEFLANIFYDLEFHLANKDWDGVALYTVKLLDKYRIIPKDAVKEILSNLKN